MEKLAVNYLVRVVAIEKVTNTNGDIKERWLIFDVWKIP